jgi:hypothetical protein
MAAGIGVVSELRKQAQQYDEYAKAANWDDGPPHHFVSEWDRQQEIAIEQGGLNQGTTGPYVLMNCFILHRDDEGKLHRTDGPAILCMDGFMSWWIDGVCVANGGPNSRIKHGTNAVTWKIEPWVYDVVRAVDTECKLINGYVEFWETES